MDPEGLRLWAQGACRQTRRRVDFLKPGPYGAGVSGLKRVFVGVGIAGIAIAAIVLKAGQYNQVRCEVCVSWHGDRRCVTTTGNSERNAMMSAMTTVCSPMTGSMSDATACQASVPETKSCGDASQ